MSGTTALNGPSVLSIDDRQELVDAYCCSCRRYAWPLYDDDPSPQRLSGADLTAPALLSYPIRGTYLNLMGQRGTPYHELFEAMKAFVERDERADRSSFSQLDSGIVQQLATRKRGSIVEGPGDWQLLVKCLDAVQECDDLTSVAVTKILHRKRPDLVPLNDTRIRSFYGVRSGYAPLLLAMHNDLQRAEPELSALCAGRETPSGRQMTPLRALDIVIWMHQGKENLAHDGGCAHN